MRQVRRLLVLPFAVMVCLSCASSAVHGAMAHLTLNSQPGSFIGQGKNWDETYTPANSDFFFAQIVQTLPGGQPDFIRFLMGSVTGPSGDTFATLDFSTAQLGTPLQPGTYDNAERASFATPGHPGLDVTFQNRGSNTLTGSFTINEISFFLDSTNTLQIGSFSASYSQSSDNNSSNISGTFSYDAQVAAAPEPSSLMMLVLGTTTLGAGLGRSRIRAGKGVSTS